MRPYVRVMILPGSWAAVLEPCRPVFKRRGTFVVFTVLATGLVAATGRRSVVGMLAGARMAQQVSFHAACRFFSSAVWDIDRLGLIVARLIVTRLLGPGEPITVVIDDTLFKRWGRQVWHAFWTHDGASQGGKKIARGNRWVIAGIVVWLPFCTAPVCLPVLLRLWAGKATTSPVELAAQMLALIIAAFPDRDVHGVGDAAYHGRPLLVPGTTWTTRLPANACLFDTAPPRTGRRGRPALKGRRLGRPAALATAAAWQRTAVYRYGRIETAHLAQVTCIWYGSFGNTSGRCVLVRELGSTKAYDLAPFGVPSAPHRRQARSTAGWNTLTTGEREPGDVDRSAADDAELSGASAGRRVGRLGGVPSQAGLGPNMSAARLAAVATSRSPADAFFKRVVGWRVLRPCDTDPGPRCSRVRLARAFTRSRSNEPRDYERTPQDLLPAEWSR